MTLAKLQHAYANRLEAAREAHAGGQGVVGLIGQTIPVEFVLAAGRFPLRITAERGVPTPNADLYMEEVTAPETRALFDRAVGGTFEFLDLLILSRPYAHLLYYLKEVYRLGRGPRIPPLHSYDLIQARRGAVRAYNWGQTLALAERLERLAGSEQTASALWQAIELTNRVRQLQRTLLARRWDGVVPGVEAMQAIGAAAFLHPATYADLLSAYLDQLPAAAGTNGADRPRLLVVSSEPLTYTDLHAALESSGARVVAEDDWWGARAPGEDVPLAGSPREAILQKYWLDTASSGIQPAEVREAWLRQQAVRPEVDGIVFYVPPSDHQFGWDYPRLREWVASIGKPQVLLRTDVTRPEGRTSVEAATRTFVSELPRRMALV